MCPPKPPKMSVPAQPPAPAAQGADALRLGGMGDDEDDSARGLLGRSLLRIGKARAAKKGQSTTERLGLGPMPSKSGSSIGPAPSSGMLSLGPSSGGGGGGRSSRASVDRA